METSNTKYCWVKDLKAGTFLANSRESVRVMGVVTSFGGFSAEDLAALSPLMNRSSAAFHVGESDSSNHRDAAHRSLGTENERRAPLQPESTTATATAASPARETAFLSVSIDDGTDSIDVCAPRQMMEPATPFATRIEIGKTYDCILKLRQNSATKLWFVDALVEIEDPMDERYRWMELSHHEQGDCSGIRYSNLCHKSGFPTRRRNASAVYRFIRLHAQLQREEQLPEQKSKPPLSRRPNISNSNNHNHNNSSNNNTDHRIPPRRKLPRWSTGGPPLRSRKLRTGLPPKRFRKNPGSPAIAPGVGSEMPPGTLRPSPGPRARAPPKPPPSPLEGLSLKDLAAVLQKPQREVREMTEDLQLEGKIYQNEKGEYLPL